MAVRLNLGCGLDRREGWVNVDLVEAEHVDMVVDLEERPWPWEDGTVERVRIHNTLEHLMRPKAAVEEIHRILRPGGLADIKVPHRDSPAACQLEHTRLFDEHSFRPVTREGKGTPGLDTPHLFDLVSVRVTHRHPFGYHQRKWLGKEIVGWSPHEVQWILRARRVEP